MREKEEAKVKKELPARRGSDHPHLFKPTAGYRTCRVCGLPRSHKIHGKQESADQ